MLLLLAACKGCWWVLEQPHSSVMEHLPILQHLFGMIPTFRHTMSMADYGGPTVKGTCLYSSYLDQLNEPRNAMRDGKK